MKNITKKISILVGFVVIHFFSAQIYADDKVALKSIYQNILIGNAKRAEASCKVLEKKIIALKSGAENSQVLWEFTRLITNWKQVETIFIADELDDDALDLPFFIDMFGHGNENIYQQIQRVVDSSSSPSTALYKNSYKTVNALEVMLFSEKQLSNRRLALAKLQVESICSYLTQIKNIYIKSEKKFLTLKKNDATGLLLNAAAQSSFLLKEWRIGNVAGLTFKFKNKPNKNRSEYPHSNISMQAISAILQTYQKLIVKQDYPNFIELMESYSSNATKILQKTQGYLIEAQSLARKSSYPSFDFSPARTKPLYDITTKLHYSFYYTLMEALPVVGKILEADGD